MPSLTRIDESKSLRCCHGKQSKNHRTLQIQVFEMNDHYNFDKVDRSFIKVSASFCL